MRILNADADATSNFTPRAAQQLPQRNAFLLRLGVPRGVLQSGLGHAMLAHLRQQRGNFASRLQRLAQQRRAQVAHDDIPRAVDVLLAVVRVLAGDALAPTLQAITMQRDQQNATGVGASEARLEEVDERDFQLAQSDGFNSHVIHDQLYCPPCMNSSPKSSGCTRWARTRRRILMPFEIFVRFRDALTAGQIRAAEKIDGRWQTNAWVKQGILLGFRIGKLVESGDRKVLTFVDKGTYPTRQFAAREQIRVIPGGSSVRSGAYVAKSVVCMPPMFINVGAYVDEGTMVDSHALVGSCAQVGKRVHISAAAQIGGVLEPINASPVIIEDDVLVGGNCGVYEGTQVGARAVLGAGVILTRSTPLFDTVKGEIYRATATDGLRVPEDAVVVPGARSVTKGKTVEWGLSLYTPVIVKYRDERTDRGVELEDLLR